MSDQHILVDLDACLDTRLPSLSLCNPEAAVKMMIPAYWERLSDDFEKYTEGMVTNVEYQSQWRNRDRTVLRGALATNFNLLLTHIFSELANQSVNTPLVSDLKLTINFWPYELTDEETEAYLTNISVFVNHQAKLYKAWLPPEMITPDLLDAEYAAYATYDYNHWMTCQHENFDKKGIPRVTVFAPAMSFVKDFVEEDITVEGVGPVSPFEMLEHVSSPYMTLHLLKMAFFCPVN
ncbi:hypothetical protein D3C87_1421520 [compost metagenome]